MWLGDVVKQRGLMGVLVFIVKQSPLLTKIYPTQAEMFTEVIFKSFIRVLFSHIRRLPSSLSLTLSQKF